MAKKSPGPSERSHRYDLTEAGRDLEPVIRARAEWLDKHLRDRQPRLVTGTVQPLGVGEAVALRAGHDAKLFRASHTMPARGYVVYRQNRKLKPEYQGVSGLEIAQARREGHAVTRSEDAPLVACTGDNTSGVPKGSHQTPQVLVA